jgi:hypothetical protein
VPNSPRLTLPAVGAELLYHVESSPSKIVELDPVAGAPRVFDIT